MTDDVVHDLVAAATALPSVDVEKLVTATRHGATELRALRRRTSGPLRHACSIVLRAVEHLDPAEICGLLKGAAIASRRNRPTLDLVWTGPEVPGSVSRLTSEVVAGLVDQARSDVLLVSYAMHNEPTLTAAIARAVGRGVFVQVLCERTADNPNFRGGSVPFPGLSVRRFCWPIDRRPVGASMHAKVLVTDRHTVLIGSANITGTAMLRNIECGVLIHDEKIAYEITTSIETLIARDELRSY
ncbi:DISARM system phospholipase D-like protein DrmC [Rhodococcus pyridinivorans]